MLVTGGAGFIGSHLVHTLLRLGHDVRVLDNFSTGSRHNLAGAEALGAEHGASFRLIEGDVRDPQQVAEAVNSCTAVAHLAAVVSVGESVVDPDGTSAVTYGGTVNVLSAAVAAGVDRFVLASSCAVYGDTQVLPIDETTATRPLSPYAQAKLASERVCAESADAGQIDAVSLRFFNVYGPRQNPGSEYSGVISRFMQAAAAGEPITIYGDGQQSRDFVYVGDVAGALSAALLTPLGGYHCANVCSQVVTTICRLADEVEVVSGKRLERRTEPARHGDIRHSLGNGAHALQLLGWRPLVTTERGFETTWCWYEERAATWPSAK